MNNSAAEGLRPLQIVAGSFIVSPIIYTVLLMLIAQNGEPNSADPEVAALLMKVFPFLGLSCVVLAEFFDRLSPRKADVPYFYHYKNNLIVKLACYSSIAIFGLMLGFLGAELKVSLAYFAAAIFFMLRIFPTQKKAAGPSRF